MSYATMKWAMEVQATPTQKHVLLVLATHANEDGEAFPSIQSICNATGLSDRAVRKARSELIDAGLLEKSSKFTRNGVRLNMARHAAQPAPDAGPHNSQLNTINSHTIPPTPQPKAAMPKIDLPDWMPVEAWDGFVEMRRKSKKPLTDRAAQLIVKKLASLRDQGDDPGEVLDRSTVNGWQGVFPMKNQANVVPFQPHQQRNTRPPRDPFAGFADGFTDVEIPELSPEDKALMRRYRS